MLKEISVFLLHRNNICQFNWLYTLCAFYVPNYYLFSALKATTKIASRQTHFFEVTSSLEFLYILKLPLYLVEKVYTNITFLILSLYLWLILFIFKISIQQNDFIVCTVF